MAQFRSFPIAALVLVSLCGCEEPLHTSIPQSSSDSSVPPDGPDSHTSSTTSSDDSSWRIFTSEEGRFRVDLPGDPELKKPSLEGNDVTYRFLLVDHSSGVVYFVAYLDLDLMGRTSLSDARAVIETLCDDRREIDGNEILRDEVLEFEGYPGREIISKLPMPAKETFRIFLVGNRVYQLAAIDSPEGRTSDDIARFFHSFELLPEESSESDAVRAASDSDSP